MSKIKLKFYQAVRGVKKHSPIILTTVGVVGLGATAYLAYKAKPKVELIVEDIEAMREDGQEIDKVAVGKELVKALALPITTGVLSAGAIVWSYNIQNNRIIALSAVLASTQAAQKAFEDRVKEKLGDTVYNEMMTLQDSEYVETDEDGTVAEHVQKIRNEADSTVGEWYDQSSEYVSDDMGYNYAFIDAASASLDMKLFSKGYLLLNEVREKLGFSRIRAGALLGWSSADYFNIETIPAMLEDPLTGEMREYIFVKWTTPKYIYGEVEFGPTFDTW